MIFNNDHLLKLSLHCHAVVDLFCNRNVICKTPPTQPTNPIFIMILSINDLLPIERCLFLYLN